MLELLGRGYIVQHCVAYLKRRGEEKAYRNYITDALKVLTKNTATQQGATYLTVRYADIVEPPKEDNRTEEEIVSRIRKKLRGQA